jgi:hypothetical protein
MKHDMPEKQVEDMTYEECTAYMASIFKEYYQRIQAATTFEEAVKLDDQKMALLGELGEKRLFLPHQSIVEAKP